MSESGNVGATLRELRQSRHMTLASVARQAGYAQSLISFVERGQRRLNPQLAHKLDAIYQTGTFIRSLARTTRQPTAAPPDAPPHDTILVDLPGHDPIPLSRKELVAALGVGVASSPSYARFTRALDKIGPNDDTMRSLDTAYDRFRVAARSLPPWRLVDAMTGHVAILEGLRQHADLRDRPRYGRLQARYAETLGWLSEEAGDQSGATYWTDRASQWAQVADWHAMAAYTFVRRSRMALTFANDGPRAAHYAESVHTMSDAPPRTRGFAARQAAYGHALTGNEPASKRALDDALRLLAMPLRDEDASLGQRSIANDDLHAIITATCDIYLGRGHRAIPVLQPRLDSITASSARTAAITHAKLAHAYAQARLPDEATHHALIALNHNDSIGSRSARHELTRALPTLADWRTRDDVRLMLKRLNHALKVNPEAAFTY